MNERVEHSNKDRIIAVIDLGVFEGQTCIAECGRYALRRLSRHTVLDQIVRRLADSLQLDGICVVGANLPMDVLTCGFGHAELVDVPHKHWIHRLAAVADHSNADWVYRVPANCPFIDPVLVDSLASTARNLRAYDFVGYSGSNGGHVRVGQLGLCGEIVHSDCLRRLRRCVDATTSSIKSDSVGCLLAATSGVFQCRLLPLKADLDKPDLRFVLENETDLDLATTICDAVGAEKTDWQYLVQLVEHHQPIRDLMREQNEAAASQAVSSTKFALSAQAD